MTREEYIDRIAAVLTAHDCTEYAQFCLCGKRLWSTPEGSLSGTGAMSMRRHRAESIIDALGLDLEVPL